MRLEVSGTTVGLWYGSATRWLHECHRAAGMSKGRPAVIDESDLEVTVRPDGHAAGPPRSHGCTQLVAAFGRSNNKRVKTVHPGHEHLSPVPTRPGPRPRREKLVEILPPRDFCRRLAMCLVTFHRLPVTAMGHGVFVPPFRARRPEAERQPLLAEDLAYRNMEAGVPAAPPRMSDNGWRFYKIFARVN
jgi:hypothetical protein